MYKIKKIQYTTTTAYEYKDYNVFMGLQRRFYWANLSDFVQ